MAGGLRLAACAWLGLAGLAWPAGSPARAAEPFTSKHGYRLRPPAGENWQPIAASYMPEPEFAIEDAASGRRFLVFVFGRDFDEHEWDLSAVTNLTWTIRKTFAASDPAGGGSAFEGLPAYECRARIVRNDADGWIRVTAILTSKCRYWIVREKAPGDPADDPELEALRASFQFTDRPEPPPLRPRTPAWVAWTVGGAVAAVLGIIALLLVRSLRGQGRKKTKRSRYTYSEKAQELAGGSAGGETPGKSAASAGPPPRLDLGGQERDIRRAARAAGPLQMPRVIVEPFLSLSQAPDPSALRTQPNTGPLKLDRRFLKDKSKGQDKPAEEDQKPGS